MSPEQTFSPVSDKVIISNSKSKKMFKLKQLLRCYLKVERTIIHSRFQSHYAFLLCL